MVIIYDACVTFLGARIFDREWVMSEAIKQETVPGHDYAYNTPLEDLDVSNPHLWPSQEMWPIFERLRDEDPLHY